MRCRQQGQAHNLQIPSRLSLAQTDPRTITAGEFFARATQDLPHFLLGDTMIENMRQIDFRIYQKTHLHPSSSQCSVSESMRGFSLVRWAFAILPASHGPCDGTSLPDKCLIS